MHKYKIGTLTIMLFTPILILAFILSNKLTHKHVVMHENKTHISIKEKNIKYISRANISPKSTIKRVRMNFKLKEGYIYLSKNDKRNFGQMKQIKFDIKTKSLKSIYKRYEKKYDRIWINPMTLKKEIKL